MLIPQELQLSRQHHHELHLKIYIVCTLYLFIICTKMWQYAIDYSAKKKVSAIKRKSPTTF